ncbi:MAG: glucose-6-phosphate dehydrogenase [Chitinivibrionales bacterium]|nr:glucose-6-phosphate dehydrogenase [Chitinivibrionales bacterium]MBD3355523.1 glucose-6-phosphate dehydrogenase [Chitinivibrionales bacterium]
MKNRAASEPYTFVVMGGTSDLMRRKILPALSILRGRGTLHPDTIIVGTGRRRFENGEYREWIRHAALEARAKSNDFDQWCERCVHYHSIGAGLPAYKELHDALFDLERRYKHPGNRVLYLATPPGAFKPSISNLGEAGLNHCSGWTRLVVEKPFGHDLTSARELDALIHRWFDEPQVYRIDHFLGKTTVQNLLIFRFANSVFESQWNRNSIDNVQITVSEADGVGGRAGYYDQAGALRDMVQNHLTQLMTLVAMEAPVQFEANAIRDEKVKVLRSIRPITADGVVYGQYTGGNLGGTEVNAYRDETNVEPDSQTETFVALKAFVDNWRWQGVPFYLRTGKRLPQKLTQIVISFRQPPVCFFRRFEDCTMQQNQLVIQLQPDEGFDLRFDVKAPETPLSLRRQSLRFRYEEAFGELPEAYKTLLVDIVNGDQTLFVRTDEVEQSWKLYTPLLENRGGVAPYHPGTWGPVKADRLLESGRVWRTT